MTAGGEVARAALLYPAYAYVLILYFTTLPDPDPRILIGALPAIALGVAQGSGAVRDARLLVLGGAALALAFVVPLYGGAIVPDWLSAVSAGIVLGAPFALVSYVGSRDVAIASRIIAFEAAAIVGLTLLAVLDLLHALGSPFDGPQFLQALAEVVGAQARAVAGYFAGVSPTNSLPLAGVEDPTFILLLGLGMLALVGPLLRPETGNGEPLPWRWQRPDGRSAERSRLLALGLRDDQRSALEERTRPSPPPGPIPPGIGALLAGGCAVALVATGAFLAPATTLAVLSLAVVTVVLGTVVVMLRRIRTAVPPASGESR